MSEPLKYPAGEFTHAELADCNGKTKQSVYNQFQAAIKDGTLVQCGTRSSGKGKPSKLYKVADANQPVVIPTVTVKVDPTDIVSVPAETAPKVVLPQSEPISEIPVEVNPEPIVVAEVTPVVESVIPTVDPTPFAKQEPVAQLAPDTHSTTYPCPVCKKNLLAWKDSTGVMVKCLQPIEVCKSTENPFGHGKNEKEAVEVLNQKWGFAIKGSPVQ